MYMIFFVLNDPNRLDEVLAAWSAAGVGGATIVESTGYRRRLRQHVPMRYILPMPVFSEREQFTLFAIVPDWTVVEACLRATEELVGDLNEPNNGILAAWELPLVKGLSSPQKPEGE